MHLSEVLNRLRITNSVTGKPVDTAHPAHLEITEAGSDYVIKAKAGITGSVTDTLTVPGITGSIDITCEANQVVMKYRYRLQGTEEWLCKPGGTIDAEGWSVDIPEARDAIVSARIVKGIATNLRDYDVSSKAAVNASAARAALAAVKAAFVVNDTEAVGTAINDAREAAADARAAAQRSAAEGSPANTASVVAMFANAAQLAAAQVEAVAAGASEIGKVITLYVGTNVIRARTLVGAAVTYRAAQSEGRFEMSELTNCTEGENIIVLITNENGGVSAEQTTVKAGGMVTYENPGVNCVVRLLRKSK